MNPARILPAVLALALLPSCLATIFRSTSEAVDLDGTPAGGAVWVQGKRYDLPATVEVPRISDPLRFEHPDFGEVRGRIPTSPNAVWIIGGLIVTPIIGFVFDTASGALIDLEDSVRMDFETGKLEKVRG